jgi:superfamily II DNA or RNA helicase
LNIIVSLQNLIRTSPGRTAREYSHNLKNLGFASADKTSVNSTLYRNLQLFEFCKDNDNTPRWFLKDTAAIKSNDEPQTRKFTLNNTGRKLNLYPWQKEALRKWKAQNYLGVVEAVTGAGKTMIGINATIEQVEKDGFVLVIVPSLELLKQWEMKLQENLPNAQIGIFGGGSQVTFRDYEVIVATVNAARRYELLPPRKRVGLLIADECHRYGSNSNKDALDERFERRLGLSATYQRNDNGNTEWLEPYFGETCFRLNYKRAIDDGVISQFSVALVGVAFSDFERAEYDEYSEKLYRLKKKLLNGFDLTEEPFGEFMKEVSLLAEGGCGEGTGIARSYLSAFEKRRALLAESPAKIQGLFKLIDAIENANRTLIFTQTVESAETIAETLQESGIEAQAIHSKMKMDERRRVLSEFRDGNLKVIVAPQVLDEGVDVPEADLAIIVAASKTRRQMIQRMGRVLRRKQDGRLARFALLFVEETSEDPQSGAHEEFIEELTSVAHSVKEFSSRATAEKICRHLNASGC